MKLSTNLKKAKTGTPFECLLYRGQYKQLTDPSRGIFYTPDPHEAHLYATDTLPNGDGTSSNRKGHLIQKVLKFKNPYVCSGTAEAMTYLMNSGAVKPETAKKLIKHGIYAYPPGERALATGMRQLGHDATYTTTD